MDSLQKLLVSQWIMGRGKVMRAIMFTVGAPEINIFKLQF
jgi:hypothetical protein